MPDNKHVSTDPSLPTPAPEPVSAVPAVPADSADSAGSTTPTSTTAPADPARARRKKPSQGPFTQLYLLAQRISASRTPGFWGWFGPLLVTLLGGILRFFKLNNPYSLVFDEVYYAKDGYSTAVLGYEGIWAKPSDTQFVGGDFSALSPEGSFVAHPPLGKILIAWGYKLTQDTTAWGWRIAVAFFGTACILLLARIVWRLFASGTLATLAGLFLSLDGVAVTGSRTAILDTFLAFFVLVTFWALIRDQESVRPRVLKAWKAHGTRFPELLSDGDRTASPSNMASNNSPAENESLTQEVATQTVAVLEADTPETPTSAGSPLTAVGEKSTTPDAEKPGYLDKLGPKAGIRWYLVVAGIAGGAATGVKWSGLYVLAVVGIFVFIRDCTARRQAGSKNWLLGGIVRGGIPAFFQLIPVAIATYMATWVGWFTHPQAWGHKPGHTGLWQMLGDWFIYQSQVLDFHHNVTSVHAYQSHPAGWLIQLRPTSFFFEKVGLQECEPGANECVQAVTCLGNIGIWWLAVPSLLVVLGAAFYKRDWRAGLIVAGYAGTYLPWFIYSQRTIFTFYTIVIVPFVVMALIYTLGWLTGLIRFDSSRLNVLAVRNKNPERLFDKMNPYGLLVITVVTVLIVAIAWYFWPIWVGQYISLQEWQQRMWIPSWI